MFNKRPSIITNNVDLARFNARQAISATRKSFVLIVVQLCLTLLWTTGALITMFINPVVMLGLLVVMVITTVVCSVLLYQAYNDVNRLQKKFDYYDK